MFIVVQYLIIDCCCFFVSLRYEWKKNDVHITCMCILKCARLFFIHTSVKRKKSTVNSYNLISNHFHAKLKGKQLWNKAKFKLIRKRKNKLTNGQVRRIIQLRAAIFKRIRNVQMQALQTVFICLLSLPFYAFFIFDSKTASDATLFTMT